MKIHLTLISHLLLILTIGFSLIIGSACDSSSDSETQPTTVPSPSPTPTATPVATPTPNEQKGKPRENVDEPTNPIVKSTVTPEDIKDLIVIRKGIEWYTYPIANPTFMDNLLGRTHYIVARFTIQNKSDYKIEDFSVNFSWYGKSGTFIGSYTSDSILDIVPAKGRLSRTYSFKCDCSQAHTLGSSVSQFNISE